MNLLVNGKQGKYLNIVKNDQMIFFQSHFIFQQKYNLHVSDPSISLFDDYNNHL